MKQEEKILLLGSLFHDIGKFEQRCTNERTKHEQLGYRFITSLEKEFTNILGDEKSFTEMRSLISEHHNRANNNELISIVRTADHLSASERVEFSEPEADLSEKWSHKFLSSLFSKVYINNPNGKKLRYYEQKTLTKRDHKILIPEYETENDIKESGHKYASKDFEDFKNQLISIFSFYKTEDDFNALINLILILFEKYLWSVPDFTGSDQTDISLYNHSKDVAGLSHAIYKSEQNNSDKLNLIIGDLPGIQNYIFNVANKKPAKVLRGRSIYVQILTRQFATIILNELGLTDANLIMLAGGKFYIIADNSDNFLINYNKAKSIIEDYLKSNFNYQLSFSSAFETFEYSKLKEKEKTKRITFGELIDRASYKLLEKRNQQFEQTLFPKGGFDENNFILSNKYISPNEELNTNKIKCAVTDIPIRKGRKGNIEGEQVDKQVENEFKIGEKVTKDNVVIELTPDNTEVIKVGNIKNYERNDSASKILLNPNLDELLKKENLDKDILRNSQIIEVANYTSKDEKSPNIVMDFGDMENLNNGARFMTLIKGDVDNLGLIMSSGLVDDENDYTAISRTTTLSNHLKYFFSYSLNGFLEKWENGEIEKAVDDNYTGDQKVYTVFAGGDDLMLIAPQSSSLKLLDAFNKTFNDFVCNNPEVHISYSLTNFKHNTPIRIVADMAEESQSTIKSKFKSKKLLSQIDSNSTVFHSENDKAGFRVFNTNLKNDLLQKLIEKKLDLIGWERDERNKVSQGVFRNLLYFSKIMKDFNEKKDTRLLMWHPKLNYMINRLLKDKNGKYQDKKVESFFEKALKINKTDKPEAQLLEKILYPVICEAIYGTRN